MRRLLPFLLALTILSLFAIPWLVYYLGQSKPHTLAVSTGQPGGVYHPLADVITAAVNRDHPRLKFKLLPSDGSVMSMRRLESGEADLALLQNGTPGSDNVRVIAPLYQEVLHILVLSLAITVWGGVLAVRTDGSALKNVRPSSTTYYTPIDDNP